MPKTATRHVASVATQKAALPPMAWPSVATRSNGPISPSRLGQTRCEIAFLDNAFILVYFHQGVKMKHDLTWALQGLHVLN